VRPLLTTSANSLALSPKASSKCCKAGTKASIMLCAAAMWIALGKTSLLDWEAFTSSLGWTGLPSSVVASEAITSLAFIFDDVPEPVWKTSIGNSA
jgi:hypothetical protein